MNRPYLIGSEIYRISSYGGRHPLAIPRVSAALDLIRAMGWLDEGCYIDSPMATAEQLARFHAPDYIRAIQCAESLQRVPEADRERYNIGRPARASGFCYFNDPVLGILALLDQGLGRIFYLDVDAHHGDGVQDAFADDDRVFTVSIHEEGRWPHSGPTDDRAGGRARNLPVPAGFNDDELRYLLEEAVLPLLRDFAPQAILLQAGADGLADDPMSGLALSNRALWHVAASLQDQAPRLLVLGGGGYNPWAVARCWAGIWATLNGIDPDVPASPAAEATLRGLQWRHSRGREPARHWLTTIADAANNGPIRDEIRAIAEATRRA